MKWSLLLLLLVGVLQLLDARGGRGGGGRGGGRARGSSGARGASRSSANRGSFRSGSSQFHTGFRQNVFHTRGKFSNFRASSMTPHSLFIISPRMPILYGSYHYYWRGHYVTNSSIPQQCEYEITDEDLELRNVTYSNGTFPKGLTFGCTQYQTCCGLECCGQSFISIFFVFALLVLVLLYKCIDSFCSITTFEDYWLSLQHLCCMCCSSTPASVHSGASDQNSDQNQPFVKRSLDVRA